MLEKLLFLVSLAGLSVVWAQVLVGPGMLLEPVQRWLREAYYARKDAELDSQWWWRPLWGCYRCVAGQAGCWGYLVRYHASYHPFEHLAFTALTIITAILLTKWTND